MAACVPTSGIVHPAEAVHDEWAGLRGRVTPGTPDFACFIRSRSGTTKSERSEGDSSLPWADLAIAGPREIVKLAVLVRTFCNTTLRQKLLQQLVYQLWCVLLHPVGYIGQPFHLQISYIALSAVETAWVQRYIPLAPHHQGRHLDYLRQVQPSRAPQPYRPIPIQHRCCSTGVGNLPGVDGQHVRRQRHISEHPSYYGATIHCQHPFGQ